MTRGVRVGRAFGVDIRLDASWFVVSILIAWSFRGLFASTASVETLDPWRHTLLGIMAAALFFVSVVVHELSHAIVAMRKGIEVESITLFIFGGVAKIKSEAKGPGDEFQIAGVGPLTSLVLAAILFGLGVLAEGFRLAPAAVLFQVLALVNAGLAIFNLVPGFPLDGGRLLRAGIWKATGDIVKATRFAAWGGKGVAAILISGGLAGPFLHESAPRWAGRLLPEDIFGGLWWVMLGFFLAQAATASYKQTLLMKAVEGITVSSVMSPSPMSVPGNTFLEDLPPSGPEGIVALTGYMGEIEGLISTEMTAVVPIEKWSSVMARQVMVQVSAETVLSPQDSVEEMLQRASEHPGPFLVMSEGQLLGVVRPSDVFRLRPVKDLEASA